MNSSMYKTHRKINKIVLVDICIERPVLQPMLRVTGRRVLYFGGVKKLPLYYVSFAESS